ncbi:hypothetical protein BC936DRAFT_142525 [Jimgerdemannia flammicorona]|uniref:CUB domain-containing protein n=1 Tax=Jimgerdemannia flammicorona TaxID=994334 RepID=A0A433DF43_9FUNG|nr:hypothetical protein BC936DRAFT_142525 [Jimgerdemannia flammicorona]
MAGAYWPLRCPPLPPPFVPRTTPPFLLFLLLPCITYLILALLCSTVSAQPLSPRFHRLVDPLPALVPDLGPPSQIQRRQQLSPQQDFLTGNCYGQQTFSNSSGTLTASALRSNYSNDMSCSWIIEAPEPSEVVKVTFDYFHTECGWDWLTFYDGNDTRAPMIGRLCGLRDDYDDLIVSTGPFLTITFSSDENIVSKGFYAKWETGVPCKYCTQNKRGTCIANTTCACIPGTSGTVCERETTGFAGFTPRSFHAAAYDARRDLMIVSGGTSLNEAAITDLLVYNFTSNKWIAPNITNPTPGPRYGHTAFVANNAFHIYGGQNGSGWLFNDMWRLDLDSFTWVNITSLGNTPPPPALRPTVVFADHPGESPKLYLFGGLVPTSNSNNQVSRRLYVYDIDTYTWSYNLRQNSIGTFASTGVYHPSTETLYIFGGSRFTTNGNVFQYHIPSNLWFLGQSQTPDQSRVYNTAALVGDNEVIFFGGQLPYNDGVHEDTNQCFFGEIDVYDLACGSWSAIKNATLMSERRMGHSMVIRNGVAWITGGNNGFDLADMVMVQFPALNTTQQQTDQYCLSRPYCSYCGNICLFDATKANLTTQVSGTCQDLIEQAPSLAKSTNVCPPRTLVPLGDSVHGSLAPSEFVDYKTFVDSPDADIIFDIRTVPANHTINFQTLNTWQGEINNQNNAILYNRTSLTIGAIIYDGNNATTLVNISNLLQAFDPLQGTNPNVTFHARDPRRFSGYYVYRLFNNYTTGMSDGQISYTFSVYTVEASSSGDPEPVAANPMGFDLTTFIIIFFTFLVLFCSLVFVGRRIRDLLLLRSGRLIWLRTGGDQPNVSAAADHMWPAFMYSVVVSRRWWEVEDRRGVRKKMAEEDLNCLNAERPVEVTSVTDLGNPSGRRLSSPLLAPPQRILHTPMSSLGSNTMAGSARQRFSVVSSSASLISRHTGMSSGIETVVSDEDNVEGAGWEGGKVRSSGRKWMVCERMRDLTPLSVEPFDVATQENPIFPPSHITSTSPLVALNFIITLPTPPPPLNHDDDDDDENLYIPTMAVATTVLRGPTRSRDDDDDPDGEDQWQSGLSGDIELGIRKREGPRDGVGRERSPRAELRRPEQTVAVFRRRDARGTGERVDGEGPRGWVSQLRGWSGGSRGLGRP